MMHCEFLLPEEERQLILVAKKDLSARNKIVESHLALVYKIASKYQFLGKHTFDDIIQEGCLGLISAINRFDPQYKNRFSTFAQHYIKYQIQKYLRNLNNTKNVSQKYLNESYRLKKYIAEQDKTGKSASIEDMCNFMRCDIDRIKKILNILASSPESSVHKEIDYYEKLDKKLKILKIINLINGLPAQDRQIVMLRYYSNLSWRDISKKIDISHESARNKHKEIIDLIKKQIH